MKPAALANLLRWHERECRACFLLGLGLAAISFARDGISLMVGAAAGAAGLVGIISSRLHARQSFDREVGK